MSTGFWESLRIGFLQLRQECAINPPSAPAGRLTAIWTAQPPPGEWELSYWEGVDGYGVTKRFEWHAQSAAARLGFGETGQKAVWFWLDRVRRDAPESHIRAQRFQGRGGTEELFSVEILDICGLSAEYCRKCEADEMAALQAQVARAPSEETPAPPERPAARSLVPDAALDRVGHSTDKVMETPFFEYRYPEGFPDADQSAIENVRLEANRKISSNPEPSYDELSASRYAWVWELVSRAAPIFGRVAGVQHWSPNRRRDTLKDFAARAARAAPLSRPAFERLCDSPEWKTLDSALFPADLPNAVENTSAPDQPKAVIPAPAPGNSDSNQESRKPTDGQAGEQDSLITPSPPGSERLIRKIGDFWQLSFDGKHVLVKDLKGMTYILNLLQAPGQSFHSVQLVSAAAGQTEQPTLGSAGEILDPKAVEQYRKRLDDIETRLSEAERNCDQAQKEVLYEEKDHVERELEAAMGLGGRPREAHSDHERVRKSVSNAIARAIDSIREHHPSLGDHLQRHIECGSFLRYSADDVPWEF